MRQKLQKLNKQLALLRGINVGGKNMIPMKDLAKIFASAGCENVRTFIQSGNVIFDAEPEVATGLSAIISNRIAKKFGCQIPVVLRMREELEATILNNPFHQAGVLEDLLFVMFLADVPLAENTAKLDSARSTPDEFIVRDREIYLKLPNGAARSKLTNAYFDSRLATVSTSRNWRTVNKLLELMNT